ncbi:MAG: 4-alpha-glucanotransferase [Chloroflexota bacterium]|jgi:4-alpha-glucanotransferase|nr:4-alpha-glucanotransferase [Chloroflexota bacterium]
MTAGGRDYRVLTTYVDAWGRRREANPDTVRLLEVALGTGVRPAAGRPAVAAPGRTPARPGACHLPAAPRSWGWAAQLYALRSKRSWGIGDMRDLRGLGTWSRGLGASFIQLNPLHAVAPRPPLQASPYYPSSRRFRNPLYIAVEEVPGHRAVAADLEPLARQARDLNGRRLLERDRVMELKMRALETIWGTAPRTAGADAYAQFSGPGLDDYATYCALAERHGADWRKWPARLRRPGTLDVKRAAATLAPRIDFHRWVQWVLDHQLERAARELPPVCDLAIGADPGGADGWIWSDVLIPGFSVGAPPDAMNLGGQDWGFPAFNPRSLAESGFTPFRDTVRANLRHAFGLRIDHVMGLFRLWLIPHGAAATEGAYVTYPAGPMLDILAAESQAARALIVGEDLGTVEPDVRTTLRRRRILSYRLLWFEARAPRAYPPLSLSSVTTHDLPTVAGVWTGFDEQAMLAAGLQPNLEANREIVDRVAKFGRIERTATAAEAVIAAYGALSRSPSRVLTATLEDALVVPERPNIPGTVDEWPNWSLALPGGLEGLRRSASARRLGAVMSGR